MTESQNRVDLPDFLFRQKAFFAVRIIFEAYKKDLCQNNAKNANNYLIIILSLKLLICITND